MTRPRRKSLMSTALVGAALAVSSLAGQPAIAQSSMVVRDFVMTKGVNEREPIDNMSSYVVEDQRAFAFARINNSGTPTTLKFVWHYGDEQHAEIPMSIGTSAGWRTWTSSNLRAGNWRVELVDMNGTVLATKSFTVGMKAGMADANMSQETTSAVTNAPSSPNMGSEMEPATSTTSNTGMGTNDTGMGTSGSGG